MIDQPDLSQDIERLFSSEPRNGADKLTLWHKRVDLEKKLSQIVKARAQNVCIDGPTGSGKSSLALTILNRLAQPSIWLPVVNGMQWPDFCEDLAIKAWEANAKIDQNLAKTPTLSISLQAKGQISAGEIIAPWKLADRIKLGVTSTQGLSELRQAARQNTISDVEMFLHANGLCLLVDDFEKAPDDLVVKIADLCKRLTYRSTLKCIVIGTGETFAKLYNVDEGLDGRLAEISVASLGSKKEIWHYLNDGFERLGFSGPRAKLRLKQISTSDADEVEDAFFDAADGMPKYINELALRICQSDLSQINAVQSTRNITLPVVRAECAQMISENISRCSKRIREAEKSIRLHVEVRMVLKAAFVLGANGVHNVDNLVSHIQKTIDDRFTYDQLMAGLDQLRSLGLYIQTGKSGEVVFAKDPMFSHVLGLICRDPKRFGKDEAIFGLFGQRSLPLTR